NVLRITGLEANRIGQTIFVGTKLPVTLKNLVTKSYRLNQITVGEASAYLIGLGASRVVTRQRPIPGVQTAQIGTASQAIVNIPTESVPTLETVAITPESGASPLLKGLQVIAEERGNSLTLIGSPKQVEFAEAQLARLDIRKRQVVINVRVVEINLNSGTALPNQTVTGNINFTGGNPTITQTAGNVLGLSLTSAAPITLPTSLLATITASVTSGQGKVLTDPSLTVQEGESASISLTEKVVTENTINITAPTGGSTVPTTTQTIKTEDVGLSLNISLARVDDNGFINLSISPAVTAIIGQTDLGLNNLALAGSFASILSKRTLNSGQIRLRDGQTLILSGIIRDSERQTTSKVPILGDIPILGALFRSEATTSNRSEVVIVVTPRVIDDSQNANWGYTYQPGPETQKVIDSNQRKSQ
ncbi:MAG: type II secretion system protein GspD, partial [Pseudanabaena sp.]